MEGSVKVGIFWVIRKKIYYKLEEKLICSNNEAKTNRIDSDFAHYQEWDKLCGKFYPDADFATYPRGRILFDVKENSHVLFVDKCIKQEKIAEILQIFDVRDVIIDFDEHYYCDNCVKDLFD